MTAREQSMMKWLGLIGFIGLNLILYSFYSDKKKALDTEKNNLDQELIQRNIRLEEITEWNDAYNWFLNNKPVQIPIEDAQNTLLNEVRTAAQQLGLVLNPVKPPNYLPALPAEDLERARVTISFTSGEPKFFEWVTRMNDAALFRALTHLSITPHPTDNTQVNVEAVVEQWINPNLPEPEPEPEPPVTPEGDPAAQPAPATTPEGTAPVLPTPPPAA